MTPPHLKMILAFLRKFPYLAETGRARTRAIKRHLKPVTFKTEGRDMRLYLKAGTFKAEGTKHREALEGTALASFRRRLAAWIVDLAVVILIFAAVSVTARRLGRGPFSDPSGEIKMELFHNAWGIGVIVAYFGLATWALKGLTLGKRLMRIRIKSLVSDRLGLWQCVERALGYAFSALEANFGFLQYFLHPNHMTLHDRIAETVVIRESRPKRKSKVVDN
jgi:uncharacterized RDD family membrane protein YckC